MSKESKCFDLNSKQKKHYYNKWKKFISNLSDKPKETESEKKEKTKTFENLFPVSTVTRYCVNRLDYNPLQGA